MNSLNQLILALLFHLMFASAIRAQSSEPEISTDPDNPVNTERPDAINHFDWRNPTFQFYNNGSDIDKKETITNFFYYSNNPSMDYICQKDASNFQPAEGWELLSVDMCLTVDQNGQFTSDKNNHNMPYLVLYNRYSGTLRVLAAFMDKGAQQNIKVTLNYLDKNQTAGLFGTYSSPANSLDQNSIGSVSSFSNYPGDKRFFYADFNISYDPCVCKNPSAFKISFSTVTTSQITLYGRLMGMATPIGKENSTATDWEMDESLGFLTGVYTSTGTSGTNAEAGMLTYEKASDAITDVKKVAEKTDKSEAIVTALEGFNTVVEAMANGFDQYTDSKYKNHETYEDYSTKLEALGMVTDFVKEQVTPEGESSPSIIQGEMSIQGSVTFNEDVNNNIQLATPGSSGSINYPFYYNTSSTGTLYSLYNKPLGVFAMAKSPQMYQYTQTTSPYTPSGNTISGYGYYKVAYRLGAPLQYIFNPDLNIDFTNTYVKGAIVIESLPGEFNQAPKKVIGIDKLYDTENVTDAEANTVDANFPNKGVYMTPFVDLSELSTYTPVFEYFDVAPGNNPKHNVYIKLIVYIQYNDLNRNGAPLYTSYVLKYQIDPNTLTLKDNNGIAIDLSGIPIPVNTPSVANSPVTTTSQGPLTIPATTYNLTNTNGVLTGQVQNIYVNDTIHITGNQVLGTGVNLVNIRSAVEIRQESESIINSEIVLEITNSNVTPIPSPPISYSSLVSSFCADNTQYKANHSASKTANYYASNSSTTSNSFYVDQEDMEIYPNPVYEVSKIRYVLMEGNEVNIFITDILGNKVLDLVKSYQSKGRYEMDLSVADLQDGIYLCTMETGNKVITKRISVIK